MMNTTGSMELITGWAGIDMMTMTKLSCSWTSLNQTKTAVIPDPVRVCCLKLPSLSSEDISPSSLPPPFAFCLLSTFSSLHRRMESSSVFCASSACCSHRLLSKILAISHTAAASSESMTVASWAWKALLTDSIVLCFVDAVLMTTAGCHCCFLLWFASRGSRRTTWLPLYTLPWHLWTAMRCCHTKQPIYSITPSDIYNSCQHL